jgi:hypothetical protein
LRPTFGACTGSGRETFGGTNAERLRGILIFVGGCLGFAGTVSTYFPFSVLGVISFGLVAVFGGLVYLKRPEARLLTAATLWFAPLGGVACIFLVGFAPPGASHDLWRVQGSIGLFGMGLALAGAIGWHRGIRM